MTQEDVGDSHAASGCDPCSEQAIVTAGVLTCRSRKEYQSCGTICF